MGVVTHGETKTRLYRIWRNMKWRCNNPKCDKYERYGGRGIKLCAEWNNSYEQFRDWSLVNGYSDSLTIDRIDNDGNYEPSNCRWADYQTQENNSRNCHYLEYAGMRKSISDWAREVGLPMATLNRRINQGHSVEVSLFAPLRSIHERSTRLEDSTLVIPARFMKEE